MLSLRIKSKPEEVLIFVYKFEKKKFKKEFSEVQVQYEDSELCIMHMQRKQLGEAQTRIRELMGEFKVIVAQTNQKLDQIQSFSELRRQYDLEIISKENFMLLLNDYEDAGLLKMCRHFRNMVDHLRVYQIIIAQTDAKNKLLELLENLYGPLPRPSTKKDYGKLTNTTASQNARNRQPIVHYENPQQYPSHHNDEPQYHTPRSRRYQDQKPRIPQDNFIKNKEPSEHILDDQEMSHKNQKKTRQEKNAYYRNRAREQKPRINQKDQTTSNRHRNDQRKEYFKHKAKETREKHDQIEIHARMQQNRRIEEKNSLNERKQPQTPRSMQFPQQSAAFIVLSVETIDAKFFNLKGFLDYVAKGNHLKKQNIRISRNIQKVKIQLLGRPEQTDLIGHFLSYFDYDYLTFFTEKQKQTGVKIIQDLKVQFPKHNISYVNGWVPLNFQQQKHKIQHMRNLISSKNIQKSTRNCYEFFCMYYKGLHCTGQQISTIFREELKRSITSEPSIQSEDYKSDKNEIIYNNYCSQRKQNKQQSRKQQVQQKQEKAQIDQWVMSFPDQIADHFDNPMIQSMIRGQIQCQFDNLSCSVVILKDVYLSKNGVWCNIAIKQPSKNRNVAQVLKRSLEQIIGKKLSSLDCEQGLKIQDIRRLPGIHTNDVFIEDSNHLVKFVTYQAQSINRVSKAIESGKVVKIMKIPNHLYSLVQQPLKSYSTQGVRRIISKHGEENIITLSGLECRVSLEVQRIQQLLSFMKQKSTSKSEKIILNVKLMQIVRGEDILTKVQEAHMVQISVNELKVAQRKLILKAQQALILTQQPMTSDRFASYMNILFTPKDVKLIAEEIVYSLTKPTYFRNKKTLYFPSQQRLSHKAIEQVAGDNLMTITRLCFLLPQGQDITLFIDMILNFANSTPNIGSIVIHVNHCKNFSNVEKAILDAIFKQTPKTSPGQKKWFWIQQNGLPIEYIPKTTLKINLAQKRGLRTVELNQEDLSFVEATHIYNKKKLLLTHKILNKEVELVKRDQSALNVFKFWEPKSLPTQFSINSTTYKIPDSEMKKVNQSKSDEVPICLGLYTIDLINKIQYNLLTGFQRPVKCVDPNETIKVPPLSFEDIKSLNIQIFIKSSAKEKSFNAKSEILKLLDKKRNIQQIIKVSGLKLSKMLRCCQEIDLFVKNITIKGNDGIITVLSYTKADIEELISKVKSKQTTNQLIYLANWTASANDFDLIQVFSGSAEFKQIASDFKIRIPTRILRVQNKHIWKRFCQEKRHLQQISNKQIKELFLFHGTSKCDPSIIYADKEESFNINYSSSNNLFGRGIYFAKEAAYSDAGYKFSLGPKNNKFCLLYCRVLVGESQQISAPTQQTRQMIDTGFRDPGNRIKYESVKSHLQGSDVYIVYKSRRAYPEYVIEYE